MQGGILQMGYRPSKDDNDAASMYMLSETGSDHIAHAKEKEYRRVLFFCCNQQNSIPNFLQMDKDFTVRLIVWQKTNFCHN